MRLSKALAVLAASVGAAVAEPKLLICSDSTASSYNASSTIQG